MIYYTFSIEAVSGQKFFRRTALGKEDTAGQMPDKMDYLQEDILDKAISRKQQERGEKRQVLRDKKVLKQQRSEAFSEGAKRMRRWFRVAAVVLVAVIALFGKTVFQIVDLTNEKKQAQAELDDINQRIALMQEELKRVTSDEYIEQQARIKLRMIKPGETLYVISSDKAE